MTRLTPDILLRAYAAGLFPMAESRHAEELHWFDPQSRCILPLEAFHVSRSLGRTLRRGVFDLAFDRDFSGVIRACADTRPETWINDEIISLYTGLHEQGRAHSAEAWKDGKLAGGVYGIALGGAFFGESMFSHRTDASKAALAWLAARLRERGFTLFDAQFMTPHLTRFGAVEISRAAYRKKLAAALEQDGVSFAA